MMLKTVKVFTVFAASLAASILADQCLDGTDTCMIGAPQRDATSLLQVGKNFMLGTGRGAILEDGDDDDKPEEGAPGMDAGPDEAPPGSDVGPGWSEKLTEVPVEEGVPGAESQLGKDWRNTPMRDFTVQCSHNTYLLGVQASPTPTSSVDVNSMPLSLDLGYRCIEIDVWPRKKGPKLVDDVTGRVWAGPGQDQVQHSLMKVTHHNNEGPAMMQGDVLNNLDLTLFVKAIIDWLEKDETEFPASEANPKMPLILSIENRADDEVSNAGKISIKDLEDYIHTVFSWLDQGQNGPRIVMEGVFGSPQGEIGKAISNSGARARQIILKSKIHSKASQLHKIIAMKDKEDMDYGNVDLKSKSKNMDACSVSEKTQEKTRELVGDGSTMVRTYPSPINQRSGNYNPSGAFKAKAQMICVNLQGHCDGLPFQQKCSSVSLGAPFNPGSQKGSECTCNRDIAASLENVFTQYGFDGYINYNAVSVEELENFPYNEAASCKAAAATALGAAAAKEGVKNAVKAPVWAMRAALGAAAKATGMSTPKKNGPKL